MGTQARNSTLKPVEKKVLASICELSYSSCEPSFRGLLYLLKGEDASMEFEGLYGYGCYVSMSAKRLGRILKALKEEGYVESRFVYENEYYLLSYEGKEEAELFLKKNPKKKEKKTAAPLYLYLK